MKNNNLKYPIQVEPAHYTFDSYITQERWNSYYHQVMEVRNIARMLGKKSIKVLEIGVGDKTVSGILKNMGHKVITMDFDKRLNPDIVAALPAIPVKKTDKFDCLLCCEVLEHLKYEDAEKSLKEIAKTAPLAVISVPHKSVWFSFAFKFWFFKTSKLVFGIPTSFLPHKFRGEHYWEIGAMGYSQSRFEASLAKAKLEILNEFRVAELPWHHIFVLKSKIYDKK